jgi:hypothetical protein
VVASSPRVDPRLVAAAFALDDRRESYAETCRRVGVVADQLGLPRPSYDTIRVLLRVDREERAEIRRLLAPVAGDGARGWFGPWDLDRLLAAAAVAAASRRRRAL